MTDISKNISSLSPEKRALLARMLKEQGSQFNTFPLSFAQQRLWFLDQLNPGSSAYNIPVAARLAGNLNVEALKQSIEEIVRRHEILRTTFTTVEGNPVQAVRANGLVALTLVDLSELPPGERETRVLLLTTEECQQPFDLTHGPLLRVTLFRLDAQEHVLLLVMHHIISDGWSTGILIREVTTLYKAFSNGQASPLPKLPIQYADFAKWQRGWLVGQRLETLLDYWKQQLDGCPPILELPTDRPRPAIRTFRGARQSVTLPNPLYETLKTLSYREGVTLFMTLLAAFKILLCRCTGQDDIIVGSPTANRNRAELESLIGFFVNILVLRTDLSDNPTFRELLERVRKATLEASEYQDLPFEQLVEELHLERDLNRMPLVQAAFSLQSAATTVLELPNLTLSPLELDVATTKTDLTLFMSEGPAGLKGVFEYDTDLFDATTIARMAGHFQSLLDAAAADPGQRIRDLAPSPGQLLFPVKTAKTQDDKFGDIYEHSNLTKNQLLIWAGQKLQPDVPLYNMVHTFTLSGGIDPEHFQKAFQTLVNSSDALRTVIHEIDGVPQQRVITNSTYTVEYFDFSQASEPQASLQTWVRERSQVPFDLENRLFDCVLIKISDQEFLWYLNVHHMIADGWSHSLIVRRISEFYERSLKGELEEKAELPSFQDYIDYEREYRSSPRYRQVESYWKHKLAETIEPIAFYGRRPIKQTTRVHRVSCDLGFERSQKLRALAVEKDIFAMTPDASLFNIFTVLLLTYLYRISGNRRLSLGIPFHNRDSKAFKETIGLFMEVCPLHITIEDEDTFLSLIKKMTVETFETLQHRYYFIANPHYNKAYDVILNYHTVSFPGFHGAPVKAKWVHSGHENDSLALQVNNLGSSGSFVLDFDFHCDIFDAGQRDQTIRHFLQGLDAFLEDRTQTLDCVKLLSAEEEHHILIEFNRTEEAFPEDQTIAQLFEAQAEKTPDKPAVVFEGQSLTYAELNSQANQLAHHLQALGVGPEIRVGLCMKRSLEMVVGLLGILKAGGAYVPLDPTYPEERLAFMLADTEVPVLVTQRRLVEQLSAQGAEVVCLDDGCEIIARQSTKNPVRRTTAENLAYVIYTSGSTGRPKGVLVTNRAVVNHNVSVAKRFGLQASDRILQFHSISFDAAVEELFPTWLSGATLVLRGDTMLAAGTDFLRLIEREKLTVLDLPTAYWHEWVSELSRSQEDLPASLRLVIVGGEKASVERLALWQKLSGGSIRWINTYGPTEATVIATLYEPALSGEEEIRSELPIGRPISNTQSYVLDRNLRPVPMGVPGELCIGGEGLAQGYLNHPETTAEKFIPNPFIPPGGDGARLYRTGDLVRYLPDGNIEFLGRIDHQVKVRGFRIELGEIEAVLHEFPAVQEAIVLARPDLEDASGSKRLVAYLVSRPETELTISELRSFVKKRLPDYMAPSAFVLLDAMPLMPNGKVDRKSPALQPLPQLGRSQLEMDEIFVAPRTSAEEVMAAIWSKVLDVEQVSIHDNFFNLGGHSLLAMQVISRVGDAFQIELPLRCIFETPTVAGLAERVETVMRTEPGLQAPPIERISRGGDLPLSFAQQRLWFIDQMEPGNPSYNMSGAVRLTGSLNITALEESLNEIVRRHESLRTTFSSVNGQPVQVITPASKLVLSVMNLDNCPETEREAQARKLVTEEAPRPFDLSQGPLFRVYLLRLGEQEHILLFNVHHIVSDEWSLGVLIRELAALYDAFCNGRPSPLPELPIQYADFAHWQRQWLRGENLEAQLSYWRQQLGGNLPVLKLPFDRQPPAQPTYRGAIHSFLLPSALSKSLKALSRHEGVTLYMVLLATLQTLLHRYSGQDSIVVGTDVANRNRLETEGLIGFFVNHLVLRTDLNGNPTFRKLLRRVREVTLRAYAHQDLPFDKLVGALQPERNLNHTPLFQVLFVFGNPAMPTLELPGLTLSPLRSDLVLSKYDLTLFMNEREQEIGGAWRYSAELFDAATITQMSDHFETLLSSIVANPDARLSSLEMLAEAERQQQAMEKRERQESRSKKLKSVSRKGIDLSHQDGSVSCE